LSYDYSPKPINELMKHLQKTHGISTSNEHTRQMVNYGYYHAYKGYRFFKKPQSFIPYTKFEELIAVIDYDNGLKSAFYREIMFLETALKNIVCTIVIDGLNSADFRDVFKERMNDDPSNDILQRQRVHLKDKIKSTVTKRYNQNNAIVSHFYERGDQMPLWAIFETISLGDFAAFCSCLNKHTRVSILRDLHIYTGVDPENQLLTHILYAMKDLRNSIAHNNVIFDTRFKEKEVHPNLGAWISNEVKVADVDFSSIIDYYLLVCVLLEKIEYEDEKLHHFVFGVRGLVDALYNDTSQNIYTKLTTTRYITKINAITEYLEKA